MRTISLTTLSLLLTIGLFPTDARGEEEEVPPATDTETDEAILQPPFALPPQFPPSVVTDGALPGEELRLQPPEPADFSIIYEGGTGGISGANADLGVDGPVARAFAARQGKAWSRQASGWGAFLRGGRWLLLPEGGVRAFRDDLAPAGSPLSEEAATVPGLLADDYAVVVWPPEAAAVLVPEIFAALDSDARRPPPVQVDFHVEPHESKAGEVLLVSRSHRETPLEFPLDPDVWETRLRSTFSVETEAGVAQVQLIGRLEGEGARRTALVQQWRGAPSLYLSAGEAVEGRSFLSGEGVSLQRPATWAQWKAQNLTALAPGELELAAGVEGLRAEAEEAGVALVSANLVDAEGKPVYSPWVLREVAGQQVALVGWTDPSIFPELPHGVRSGVKLQGVEAVQRALIELDTALESPPDLVVFFGVGARDIAGDLAGIDIVLGDFSTQLRLARWEEVGEAALRARSLEHPRARAPALVSRLGGHMVGRIDLAFDDETGALRRLRHLRARVAEEQPVDEDSVRAIQAIRQAVYHALETTLVPGLDSLEWPATKKGRPVPPDSLDRGALIRLGANLLMDRTGADLALLRPLPPAVSVPGETAELFVDAALSVLDEVVLVELTGAELKQVLRTVVPVQPTPGSSNPAPGGSSLWGWVAGAKRSGVKVTVRGRLVADTDVFRLATTDFFVDDPALGTALKKTRISRSFTGDSWRRLPTRGKQGSPWRLHDLVKNGLVQLRDGSSEEAAEPAWAENPALYARQLRPLLLDQAGERSGRLSLELDGIALQLTGSLPVGEREDYASSTESRIHQAQAMNLSARGRIALVWDDRIGSATTYGEFAFGEQRTPETEEPTELEDDLELGVEGRLRLISLPAPKGKVGLSSFLQGAFDTEFTKPEEADESQKTLRFTTGASFGKYLFFRELKAGFFLEYDMVSEQSPVAPGFSIYGKMEKLFGPVKWSGFADFRGYIRTPHDSLEDLQLTLQLRTDLAVLPLRKFVPGLSIGAFADAFVFQGVPPVLADGSRGSAREPGLHLLVGMAISYDNDLKPPLRLR